LIDRTLKNRGLLKLFLAGILYIVFCLPAFGLVVPERPEGRVTDRTGTLTRDQIQTLEKKLSAFEKETTNQIAVLLIPSLEGDSLEDYSIRLAEKWKIGQQGRNNGVILLIVKNDRKLRIEVGYGLEGALPDALAGTIIRNEIAPRFKAGQFSQGVEAGIDSIIAATKGEYKAGPKKTRSQIDSWIPFLVVGAFIVFFMLAASQTRRRHYHSGGSRGWNSGGGFWSGGSSWGGGGSDSGGFSGGGGDFGGGGASGDW
jgi:uncharacterized protein